jgi:isoleucyl-tRNA synthetase
MSKSLKNFPDPVKVLNEIGSDALRLYLINSPVVRGEPLRFSEQGCRQVVSQVLLPLWNSMNFFLQQVDLLKKKQQMEFMWKPESLHDNTNVMDRWILAECQSLIKFVNKELGEDYKLYTVVPRLLQLIESTTNWYIRFNRSRLKGANGVEDTLAALNCLFEVLYTQIRSLAPFIPFLTDTIFQRLRGFIPESHTEKDMRSVHFLKYPTVREELFDEDIERRVRNMQAVIQLGRLARERRTLPLKTPLKTLTCIHSDPQFVEDVQGLQSYIIDELNIVEFVVTSDEEKHGVVYSAQPDLKSLGVKFKKAAAPIKKALPSLSTTDIKTFMQTGRITVADCELVTEDLRVKREIPPSPETKHLEVATDEEGLLIVLDTVIYPELAPISLAREFLNRVQKLRKAAGLVPTDDVRMSYRVLQGDTDELDAMFKSQRAMFDKAVQGDITKVEGEGDAETGELLGQDEADVRGLVADLKLWRL